MKNFVLQYINRRIRRNQNVMLAVVGGTGSGKSYSSLKLAETLDSDFNCNRVVFTVSAFLRLVKRNLPAGSVIVFEEAGVEAHNRTWYSKVNRALNYVAQTFRNKNLVVIFNAPNLNFIDSQVRTLFHMLLETAGIWRKDKMVRLKTKIISVNRITGKAYQPYLRIGTKRGIVKCKYAFVGMPSKKLAKEYEKKKNKYEERLYNDLKKSFQKNADTSILTERQRDIHALLKHYKPMEVAERLDISSAAIYQARKRIKKKLKKYN